MNWKQFQKALVWLDSDPDEN